MKIAILLMIHEVNDQVNNLIKTFNKDLFDIYIHVDKKVLDLSKLYIDEHIYIKRNRISVTWGTIDIAKVHLNLLESAQKSKKYSHFILISGQDLPIKNTDLLYKELSNNLAYSYIDIIEDKAWVEKTKITVNLKYPRWMAKRNKAVKVIKKLYQKTFGLFAKNKNKNQYFGSVWMTLNKAYVEYLFSEEKIIEKLVKKYKNSLCSDETIIHTHFMASPFKDFRKPYLTYVDWSEGLSSPKLLTIEDYERIMNSNMYFARKFDAKIDKDIIDKILKENNN